MCHLPSGQTRWLMRHAVRPAAAAAANCNAITSYSTAGGPRLLVASNDNCAWAVDLVTGQLVQTFATEWPVNRAVAISEISPQSVALSPVAPWLRTPPPPSTHLPHLIALVGDGMRFSAHSARLSVCRSVGWLVASWSWHVICFSLCVCVEFSGPLAACVTRLLDPASGRTVAEFEQLDFAFGAASSPDGRYLATGGQGTREVFGSTLPVDSPLFVAHSAWWVADTDRACRVFDVRKLSAPVWVLPSPRTAAVRAVSFSPGGQLLAVAEDSDCVRVYDVGRQCSVAQDLPCIGDISGVAFSPDDRRLLVGVAHPEYGCLLTYDRPDRLIFDELHI